MIVKIHLKQYGIEFVCNIADKFTRKNILSLVILKCLMIKLGTYQICYNDEINSLNL